MKSRLILLLTCLIAGSFLFFTLAAARDLPPDEPSNRPIQPNSTSQNQPRAFWYERTFGVTETAYLADTDHLNWPVGVDVDSAGNLWVVEEYGARVLKYASDGAFLMSIGTAGLTYLADETHFCGPSDVAVDSTGNFWVVDSCAARAVKFDPTGDSRMELGWAGQGGSDNAHFAWPKGIAFDSAGNIYVGDEANHRVQIFDPTGFYSTTIGVTGQSGSDNAHFYAPVHITVDDADNLYVADTANHRVQIFDSSHTHTDTLGISGVSGSDDDHLDNPRGVAVDAAHIYVADGGNHRLQVFDRATHDLVASLGHAGSDEGEFNWPSDVAVDSAGNLYVADLLNFRVQVFDSNLDYVRTIGTSGVPYLTDGYHYNQPVGVAVDDSGNIAVVEGWGRGNRLIKLNSEGVPQFTIGEAGVMGDDLEHFADPFGVAFDASGKIYVADCGNYRVQVFSSEGVWGARIGSGYGTGNDEFNCPSGVATDGGGNIYVSDGSNHRIQIFDSNRFYTATLGTTGEKGTDNDHFNWPMDVEVNINGDVLVADTLNHRVQVFDSDLSWKFTLGVTGVCVGDNKHLCEPWGVAVDGDGNIYVAEKFNPRVQVFDLNGAYQTTIAGEWGDGQYQLRGPYDVDVDSEGNVYIADLNNHRVEKYYPGSLVFLPAVISDYP